jgi:hypothetical protein
MVTLDAVRAFCAQVCFQCGTIQAFFTLVAAVHGDTLSQYVVFRLLQYDVTHHAVQV